MTAAVRIDHLTVCLQGAIILDTVCAEIPQGVLAALIGPNGAGKTTLLKSLVNIIPRVAGNVLFMGKPYAAMQRQIAYIPQRATVDWNFPATCNDIVLMGRYGALGWFKRPTLHDKALAEHALEQVGLSDYANRSIQELSGGQQQRLFIARALTQESTIYLLDEPFAGIDTVSESIILNVLSNLRNNGSTIIIVHHDLNTIVKHFDWTVCINKTAIAYGPTAQIINPHTLGKTYGSASW